MKRFNTALALACAFILSMGSAFADPTFGYPNSYTLATDLNQNNAQTTANVALNPSSPPQCNIQVYGTFSANLQIYTSVLGTFGDEVSVGSAITAPTYGTAITVNMAGNRAIRVIDTAYTSGDPVVAVDCSQGQLVTAPVTPAALSVPPYITIPLMAYGPWVSGASASNFTTLEAAITAADNTALAIGGKACILFPSATVDPKVSGDIEVPLGVGFCGNNWNSEYEQDGQLKFDGQTFANNLSIVLGSGPGGASDSGMVYANLDNFLHVRWAWACCPNTTGNIVTAPINCQQSDVQFRDNMWIIEENTTQPLIAAEFCGSDTTVTNPIFKDVNTGANQSFEILDNPAFPAASISIIGGTEYGGAWTVPATITNVTSALTQVQVTGFNFQTAPTVTALDSTSCVCYNNTGSAQAPGLRGPQVIQVNTKSAAATTTTAALPYTASTSVGHELVAIIQTLQSSAVTTPTGWTALGSVCGLASASNAYVFYRTPSGTSADQVAFVQANATAFSVTTLELANAGTPTGLQCTTQNATAQWDTAQFAASANELVIAYHTNIAAPTVSSPPQTCVVGWTCANYDTATLGQNYIWQSILAQTATNYAGGIKFGGNQSGVSIIFGIPAAI